MTEKGIIYNAPRVESWDVPGVFYRDKTETYRVIGEMIPAMTQDEQMEKYGIQVPSSQLIWAIATRDYDLRKETPEPAESLRKFIQEGLKKYPNTSTRDIYMPEGRGLDTSVHDYKTPNQHSLEGDFVGNDGFISKLNSLEDFLNAHLGTSDNLKIDQVSQWINGTGMYIYRKNSKPSRKYERVVGFGADSVRLVLDCSGDPLCRYPAFRVEKVD